MPKPIHNIDNDKYAEINFVLCNFFFGILVITPKKLWQLCSQEINEIEKTKTKTGIVTFTQESLSAKFMVSECVVNDEFL